MIYDPNRKDKECGCSSKFPCAACEGVDIRAWQDDRMKKVGWYIHATEGPGVFVNFHTHGFEKTFGHPNMQIVIPVEAGVASDIFNTLVKRIKKGEKFSSASGSIEGVIKDYKVRFAEAKEGDRGVLRILLPDKHGRFPGDPEVSELFASQLSVQT